MYDILSGIVEMNNIFGALLIEVKSEVMPVWQRTFKRLFDIVSSVISLVLLSPLFVVLAFLVKASSPDQYCLSKIELGKMGRYSRSLNLEPCLLVLKKMGLSCLHQVTRASLLLVALCVSLGWMSFCSFTMF